MHQLRHSETNYHRSLLPLFYFLTTQRNIIVTCCLQRNNNIFRLHHYSVQNHFIFCSESYTSVISSLLCDTNKILRSINTSCCSNFSQSSKCDEKSISFLLYRIIFYFPCRSFFLIYYKLMQQL